MRMKHSRTKRAALSWPPTTITGGTDSDVPWTALSAELVGLNYLLNSIQGTVPILNISPGHRHYISPTHYHYAVLGHRLQARRFDPSSYIIPHTVPALPKAPPQNPSKFERATGPEFRSTTEFWQGYHGNDEERDSVMTNDSKNRGPSQVFT